VFIQKNVVKYNVFIIMNLQWFFSGPLQDFLSFQFTITAYSAHNRKQGVYLGGIDQQE